MLFALVALLLILVSFVQLRHVLRRRRWDHFPGYSSFTSLPLIGHTHRMNLERPFDTILDLHKKYGPVVRFDYGNFPTVFIGDYHMAVEAFNGDAFNDRPFGRMPGYRSMRGAESSGNIPGVGLSEGRTWQEGRKFMLQNINNFVMKGRGGSSLEDIVREEAMAVSDMFKELVGPTGAKITITDRVNTAVNNIIWRMVTGERSSTKDPKLIHLTEQLDKQFKSFDPLNIFTVLQVTFPWFCKLCKMLNLETSIAKPYESIIKAIHAATDGVTADKDGTYVERFYAEISDRKATDSPFSSLNGTTHLEGTVYELLVAGTDTTRTFVEWAITLLAVYPEVQEKCLREIQEKIGDRFPQVSDQELTPYCMAVIHEGFRRVRAGVFNVPHMTGRDVTLKGHFFPKGTQVYVTYGHLNMNPEEWPEADSYIPERHLNSEGKFVPNEKIHMFGIGRRRCVGERLAVGTTYMFLVTLLQTFAIRPVPGHPVDLDSYVMGGVLATPKPVPLEIKPRF